MVLEKTFESPLDSREGDPTSQSYRKYTLNIGRTDAEAEALVVWPLSQKADSLGKTLMLEKIEGKGRRG